MEKSNPQLSWLRIDERRDVLVSLSACLLSLKHCEDDPALWKWAILSLHNALQGCMVCHLSGTAQIGALSQKCANDWYDWHERDRRGDIKRISGGTDELGLQTYRLENGSEPPSDRLADIREFFSRLSDERKRVEGGAGGIVDLTASERSSFKKLHSLRNSLVHFTPKGWSIEIGGLPDLFLNILRIIEKISHNPWPFRHMEVDELSEMVSLIENLYSELTSIKRKLITSY